MSQALRYRMLNYALFAAFLLLFSGCITSGSFQTGKTLQPGRFNAVMGVQQVASLSDGSLETAPELAAAVPRAGINVGLPLRLEIGAHVMLGQALEFNLRHELTPARFRSFDLAAAYVHGTQFGGSYRKYGATLSRQLGDWEIYGYYFKYQDASDRDEDWVDNSDWLGEFLNDARYELIESANTFGLGLSIPLLPNSLRLLPELRLDVYDNESEKVNVGFLGLCIVAGPWAGGEGTASDRQRLRRPKGFRQSD
jgi:hypothetical protein